MISPYTKAKLVDALIFLTETQSDFPPEELGREIARNFYSSLSEEEKEQFSLSEIKAFIKEFLRSL